jgi:hypothetical protein
VTPGQGAFGALEASGVARAMRESLWLYPGVEIVHIAGLAVLVGSVVMFDLRLLGVGRFLSVRALARFLLPWSVGALVVIVPSGLMMFSAHASEMIDNTPFMVKMLLLVIAGTNAALFHTSVFRGAAAWDTGVAPPAMARVQAVFSLALWLAVISCGRLIAYT